MKSLKEVKWKAFSFESLFTIKPGIRLVKDDMIKGVRPFIGATDSNNGITAFCGNTNASIDSNVLGINYNGSVVENFYHPYEAIFSDDVKRIHLKEHIGNKYIYLFIKNSILKQKKKYQYGYKFNGERMSQQYIMLPVNEAGEPDYEFMEEYMKTIEKKLLKRYQEYLTYTKRYALNISKILISKETFNWEPKLIEDIFEIESGHDIYEKERIKGDIPYVTATANQNGIGYFVGNTNESLEKKCISVNRNGSVGYAFYHPYNALYGNDTRKLRPFIKNHYASFFLARMVTEQKNKFSYGLKLGTERLKKQNIMIPFTKNGDIDYPFMEKYMRAKEYEILNRYITKRLSNL